MKRIKAACICQTLHFTPKEGVTRDRAARLVRENIEKYKAAMDRSRTQYRIVDENELPDGSMIVRVIKECGMSPVGDYLEER